MTSLDDPERLKNRIAMKQARRECTAELQWRLIWAVARQIRRETEQLKSEIEQREHAA